MKRTAEDLNDELEDFGELQVAEYIVFLLALDTYMRYVEESHGVAAEDDLVRKGIALIRMADRQHKDAVRLFLDANLANPVHKHMVGLAFGFLPTQSGLGNRSLKLRTLLAKGGASTMKAVFDSNLARKYAREAIEASLMKDADAALDKFAVIPMRHQRMRTWIDVAAEQAGAGTFQNPIQAANHDSSEASDSLVAEKLRQKVAPPGSEEAAVAEAEHTQSLVKVQTAATSAAQRAMLVSKESDVPPSKSEVIGIAAATVAAAMSDPDKQSNVPSALRGPIADDPEQLRAAMTSGRVLVAAGAGSGKTTTLIGRMAYLVQDLKVDPSRIFAVTFNKEAAFGIEEKITQKIGQELAGKMSIGTMHSTFRGLVMDYGSPEEKAALGRNMIGTKLGVKNSRTGKQRKLTNFVLNTTMAKLWKTCFEEDPPRGPGVVVQKWIMNNISPEQALADAVEPKERAIATWYEWVQGFKGITKGWRPACVDTNREADEQWTGFLAEFRSGGKDRLGDFSDMIVMARDLLKRNPAARKKLQSEYDHICVDEAQDLNEVQHEIIRYMSEHVECDDQKRSLWMVGDEIQSINNFVGARPDLFTQFHNDDCFKTRMIGTNYRCQPEIIEAANRLMEHHPRGIPMETRPSKKKARGEASILLLGPEDHASGAVEVVSDIKQQLRAGAALKDFAILSRNRIELNDYETACIIEGIPYGRKNGTSFLKSPETTTVLSYIDLAVGADFAKMQQSLIAILDKPVRLFLPAGRASQVVEAVVNKRARRLNISSKQVNPLDLFDRQGINDFLDEAGVQQWAEDRAVDALEDLGASLKGLRDSVQKGKIRDRATGEDTRYTTKHLIDAILTVRGVADRDTGEKPRLLDVLMPLNLNAEEEPEADDPDEDVNDQKPVGNVAFLYQIAHGTPDSPEADPSSPLKFKARLDDLEARSQDLRINLEAWREEQKALPENERRAPPCVVLSTVHSVKGAQWDNTTVIMAEGVFPRSPKRGTKAQEEAMSDEARAKRAERERIEFLTERQLAYVAMTRAAKNLTVVSPRINAYGRKARGTSVFVQESGLQFGQNVEGKSVPDALADSIAPPPPPEDLESIPESEDDGSLKFASSHEPRSIIAYYNIGNTASQFPDEDRTAGYDWRGR